MPDSYGSKFEIFSSKNTEKNSDVGKKIHSGRSRNDQVLVDLKLYIRAELQQVVENNKTLFGTLQNLSEEHKEKLIPGFTHLQIAMPSSYGLWFGAYAESLVDDLEMLLASFKISNQNYNLLFKRFHKLIFFFKNKYLHLTSSDR